MRILFATDFEETAGQALDHVVYLAKALEAEILLVHGVERGPNRPDLTTTVRSAEERLRTLGDVITSRGANVASTMVLRLMPPALLIAASAEEIRAALVVVGATNGPSVLGSVLRAIVQEVRLPVWVVQRESQPSVSRIVQLPASHSPAPHEVQFTVELARALEADLDVISDSPLPAPAGNGVIPNLLAPSSMDPTGLLKAQQLEPDLIALTGRRPILARQAALEQALLAAPLSAVLLAQPRPTNPLLSR